MNLQPYAAAVVAASGVAGFIIQARRTNLHAAELIKRELEILDLLPDDSTVKKSLQARIETSIEQYMSREYVRNWSAALVCLVILSSSLYFFGMIAVRGGWWWISIIGAIPFGMLGVLGIAESIGSTRRNALSTPRLDS
ncbi:hypothetical protein RKD19_004493 [Streptomyces canus]|uniref:hypothetical protein n=1 Tax=Streptomyces sp. WSLK1-3 TaxID=3375475 RepID=UPI0037B65160